MPDNSEPPKDGLTQIKPAEDKKSVADELDILFEALGESGEPLSGAKKKSEPAKTEAIKEEPKKEEPKVVPKPVEPAKVVDLGIERLNHITDTLSATAKLIAKNAEQLSSLETKFESKIASDTHVQNLFNALHQELKSYKDQTLLDTYHKPFIRDLILFFDDVARIDKQFSTIHKSLEGNDIGKNKEELSHLANNVSNLRHQLMEILNRLDVEVMEDTPKKMDKNFHKPVKVQPTDKPEDDGNVIEVINHGFTWRGKVFRAEEVAILKHDKPK